MMFGQILNHANAQTLTTAGGVNYDALSFVPAGASGAITFNIQNSNPQARVLSRIDCYTRSDQSGNLYKLWYSSTSLSGPANITTADWTLIATGTPVSISVNGLATVLTNINFAVPGNTQYRFALETNNGIAYSGVDAGIPTPNSFSAGGLSLKLGSNQVAGRTVGYGGLFPNPVDSTAFFTGAVFFVPCTNYTIANAPVLTPDTMVCGAGSPVTLRVLSGSLNQATRWNWYSSSCGGTLIGTGNSITITSTVQSTYYVRGEGGCAFAPGLCGSVNVSVAARPPAPVINPVAPICDGAVAHLVINTATALPVIWSPVATLYTDAAATIPYDGVTPRMDIYAKPRSTNAYSVFSSSNGCTSSATAVTVVVNPAIRNANTMLPADTGACEFGAAMFTAAASTANATYQWQTDNATGTFVNIVNSILYSGANTDSLSIQQVPIAWNNYRYRCIMTSAAPCLDTVQSRAALLRVNATPIVTLSASATALMPGMQAVLNAVTTNTNVSRYFWRKDGQLLTGNSSPALGVDINNLGIYKVSTLDANGCTGTSNEIEIADSSSEKLFIYPNPSVNGRFAVSYYSVKGNVLPRMLTIYNAQGELVVKKMYSVQMPYYKMEVDMSKNSKGTYLINLQTGMANG